MEIYKTPFLLDTEALALGCFVVLDINRKVVKEFESISQAEIFLATSNNCDIETVRKNNAEHGRMLSEYQKNIKEARQRENAKTEPSKPPSSGWRWSDLPDEIKQRFPPPPDAKNFDSIEEFEEAKGYWVSRIGRNIAMVMQRYENR